MVADNLLDTYSGHVSMMRKDFDKLRQDMNRGFDIVEIRLSAMEEVLVHLLRLVQVQ